MAVPLTHPFQPIPTIQDSNPGPSRAHHLPTLFAISEKKLGQFHQYYIFKRVVKRVVEQKKV